ncbi:MULTISPECIES: acyl-CoA dehydrogenase family protein [Streptomyces]|uniref:acyl-CoA dehydrogenase family protein n=1 Tax=Streptomyces TaxID=1883 RepID=UPI0006FA3E1E|nr:MULTISPECIES: acyl-CoA dehydrogenase [Streptomyces]KQX84028.1 acyl-CoA oxidase [Streptomyces sp. Root1319]KQZ04425.1 acyl-CoA oxidase [Streptomyces sp. Root55]WRY83548.1 acyl-CoA oxidase [Streptomyces clavifer]WUC29294.1 acyl-CoA oxidase [Streptomyces clavifer]
MIPLQIERTETPLAELTDILFAHRLESTHERWRSLFGSTPFAFREGLSHQERIALSYDRLRLVNAEVADPRHLVADPVELTALHEWAGIVDPGMATVASIHYNLFLGSLQDHDQAGRDVSAFLRADRVGTFLCTELAHGNDAAQMETTATLDRASGELVLNTPTPGAAKYMPNTGPTGGAKSAVVAARLIIDGDDNGVFLFLTPLSDEAGRPLPGVEVSPLPQAASSPVDHCTTVFREVRLPLGALLQGDHGRLTPEGAFSSSLGSPRKRFLRSIGRVTMGKLCMSAYSLGVTRHALAVAMRHAHSRVTSGMTSGQKVPLIAHRSHHAPLLDAVATTYAATLLHRSVVQQWTWAEDSDREANERLTAVAKGWITWQARTVMTECRERCGAQGLLLANGIAGQLAANEGTITAEGDNKVIWVKAAGEMLLGGFAPKPPSEIAPEHRALTDPEHLQDLMADLERIWHARARKRLRERAASPMARWNAAVTPALHLVDSHVHRLAGEALLTALSQAAAPLSRDLLRGLHALFALRWIAAHSGDLLAEGRMTAAQVQELPDAVEDVVAALAPHALTLTDAFAVPDALLDTYPMLNP